MHSRRVTVVALFVLILVFSGLQSNQDNSSGVMNAACARTYDSKGSASRPTVTEEGRQSIERGTKWLVSTIRYNGAVGVDDGTPPDLGCTAIVGLALLSQGNTPTAGPHSAEVQKILSYLLSEVEKTPEGTVPIEGRTQLQMKIGRFAPLFFMALFFSQVYGESYQEEAAVRKALHRIVDAIAQSQLADGTWGEESWAPVLGTVVGWEALRASASAGMTVEAAATLAGEALLKKMKERNEEDTRNWMFSFYKETASLRALYSLGYHSDPVFLECVDRVLKLPTGEPRLFTEAGGEEFLAFFLISECMMKQKEASWATWYPAVSQRMVGIQNRDGSWSGHHCITSRTFCTAAALLTLQTPYRNLPSSDF